MNCSTFLSSLLLVLSATGCTLPSMKALPAEPLPAESSTRPIAAGPQVTRSQPKLYGRDGRVVGEQTAGTTMVASSVGQTSVAEENTRWTLLEKYQSVLAEKEELEFEVTAMVKALEQSEEREAKLAAAGAAVQNELNALAMNMKKLKGHNVELASRLTTAQVRRLQSEKLLLEAKLDWRRIEATINAPAGDPTSGPLDGEMPGDEPNMPGGPVR